MAENKPEKKDYTILVAFIVSTILIVGLWYINLQSLKDLPDTKRGTFGDMFGAANALFSGLAFAGIIITILLQRKELSLQREELKQTRAELERTAEAQENSEKALKKQAENLHLSARLTALNTLVNYYAEQVNLIQEARVLGDLLMANEKKEYYLDLIEELFKSQENLINRH